VLIFDILSNKIMGRMSHTGEEEYTSRMSGKRMLRTSGHRREWQKDGKICAKQKTGNLYPAPNITGIKSSSIKRKGV
jgi:hypothetical protein